MSLLGKLRKSVATILLGVLAVQLMRYAQSCSVCSACSLAHQVLGIYEACMTWLLQYIGTYFISVSLFVVCMLLQMMLIQRRCCLLESYVTTWRELNEQLTMKFEELKQLKVETIAVIDSFQNKSQDGHLVDLFLTIEENNNGSTAQETEDPNDHQTSDSCLKSLANCSPRDEIVYELSPEMMKIFADNIRKLRRKSQSHPHDNCLS